jgi:hypothetical protein
MPVDQLEQSSIDQQALNALKFLSDSDKHKVLEYIASLVTLEKVKDDQTSSPQN